MCRAIEIGSNNSTSQVIKRSEVPKVGASLEDTAPLGDFSKHHRFEEVYSIHRQINSGNYGIVYSTKYNENDNDNRKRRASSKHKSNNECYYVDVAECATKVVDRTTKKHRDFKVRNEVSILRDLREVQGIVKLLDYYESPEYIYIVQVRAMGGDVCDRMWERGGSYSEDETKDIALELLSAIKHMHDRGIVHRDIKPENLLLKDEKCDHMGILLCDFGFAKRLPDNGEGFLTTRCGTPNYAAPEILERVPYQQEVDMWSTGCTLYVLLSGQFPFTGPRGRDMIHNIRNCRYEFYEKQWGEIDVSVKTCISNLLLLDRTKRWTAEQTLQCDWIARKGDVSDLRDEKRISFPSSDISHSLREKFLKLFC